MITEEGCKTRVARFLEEYKPTGPVLLGDPIHLCYFANAYAEPFHLGAEYQPFLVIKPDGHTTLIADSRMPSYLKYAFVDERITTKWYDGKTPGKGTRRLIIRDELEKFGTGGRVHDAILDPDAPRLHAIVDRLRRRKDPDEIEQLKQCMRLSEFGHAWAVDHVEPAMSEIDVYAGIVSEITTKAGWPSIVYGDFAISPGPSRRGGMATNKTIFFGDMLILDFSVVVQGYRSDFTNTLVVGKPPKTEQKRIITLCHQAMAAGEAELRAGAKCQAVYDAVRGVFAAEKMDQHFGHHAGHGLGLTHPEAPFFVEHSEGELVAGDVVTLEPGLYVEEVGGCRIEHNYLITDTGYERLSNHVINSY